MRLKYDEQLALGNEARDFNRRLNFIGVMCVVGYANCAVITSYFFEAAFYPFKAFKPLDRKSTRLNSSH